MSEDIISEETGTTVEVRRKQVLDIIQGVDTLEAALAALTSEEIQVLLGSEFGDGFEPCDKADLVGVPMLLVDWRRTEGDYGQFSIVRCITQTGKWVFTDGSTGIHAQLQDIEARLLKDDGYLSPIALKKGLAESKYTYEDDKGGRRPAITYYLHY